MSNVQKQKKSQVGEHVSVNKEDMILCMIRLSAAVWFPPALNSEKHWCNLSTENAAWKTSTPLRDSEPLGCSAAMPSSRGARRNEYNTYENRTLDWASRQTAGRVILGRWSLSLNPRTLPRCKDEATTNYLRLRMLIGPSPPKKESSFHTANFYFSSALQNPRYWENQLRLRAVPRGLRWDGRRALT